MHDDVLGIDESEPARDRRLSRSAPRSKDDVLPKGGTREIEVLLGGDDDDRIAPRRAENLERPRDHRTATERSELLGRLVA